MGKFNATWCTWDKLDGTIKLLIEMRNTARSDRNYLLSDQIRNRLFLLNIHLEDGKTELNLNIDIKISDFSCSKSKA